jgi:hypothetical protein
VQNEKSKACCYIGQVPFSTPRQQCLLATFDYVTSGA